MCTCNDVNNENKYNVKPFIQCGDVIVRTEIVNTIIKEDKLIHIIDFQGTEQIVTFKSKKACNEAFDYLAEDLKAF